MSWTSPADILRELQRYWDRGDILRARLTGEPFFPKDLRLRRPSSQDITQDFGRVQDWVRTLKAGSSEQRGFGYGITWRGVNHRVQGHNLLPAGVSVASEGDALRLLGKQRAAERFAQLADATLSRFATLQAWLERRPLMVLEHAEQWPRILDILAWVRERPRPNIYLRQVDLAGIDSKFIEGHRRLLGELLDEVLSSEAIDRTATGVSNFAQRYGFRGKSPLVRFRVLDPALAIAGLSDISVPAEHFASLHIDARRVFITENEINGLAFPDVEHSVVIFGLGYGLHRLSDISWLQHKEIFYWGDLDTHGFAILNRLRTTFPTARSFLMDEATLQAHRALWGQEPADRRFLGELPQLTPPEQDVFHALRDNRWGERVRLEQERIGFAWLEQGLGGL